MVESSNIVYVCLVMHLLTKYGTKALRKLMTQTLFRHYLQTRRATFTQFIDNTTLVIEHSPRPNNNKSERFHLPKPLPDIDMCKSDEKNGQSLRSIIEGPFLLEVLNKNKSKLLCLKKKNFLTGHHWDTLYANSTVTIDDLDISLLSFLLFNVFSLVPTANMKDMPLQNFVTISDDVLRLRIYRNRIAHRNSMIMEVQEFEDIWVDLSAAIIRLLGPEYQSEIDNLKTMSLDEATVNRYKQLREEWVQDLSNIYQSISNMEDMLSTMARRRPRGVAIQLQNPDDDLSKALVVLGNKGIAYRVISCDQSDSELTLNTTYDVPSRSQSTEYLNISEEIDPNPELSKSLHDLLAKPSKKKTKPFRQLFKRLRKDAKIDETRHSSHSEDKMSLLSEMFLDDGQIEEEYPVSRATSEVSMTSYGSVFECQEDERPQVQRGTFRVRHSPSKLAGKDEQGRKPKKKGFIKRIQEIF